MIMDELETNGTTSRITFWYGARTNEHIVYQEEFDALAAKYPNFSWHIVLSELADSDDWHGPRGMVHEVVRDDYLSSHPSLEQCAFYVCGPPLMLEAVLQLLEALKIPDARIAFDDFGS
jgi:Na+-transporting NADH:ubiquinone oxidoreductase subunit NqrF